MSDHRAKDRWTPSGIQVGSGMLEGYKRVVDDASKAMLRDAPKAARLVAKRIPGAPGLVLDAVQMSTSEDGLKTGLELAAGATLGLAGGVVGGPFGAAVGAAAGEKAAELIYDHRDDIRAWMKDRRDAVARRTLSELQRYVLPPQLREPY